jgi:hypothetical protein
VRGDERVGKEFAIPRDGITRESPVNRVAARRALLKNDRNG